MYLRLRFLWLCNECSFIHSTYTALCVAAMQPCYMSNLFDHLLLSTASAAGEEAESSSTVGVSLSHLSLSHAPADDGVTCHSQLTLAALDHQLDLVTRSEL